MIQSRVDTKKNLAKDDDMMKDGNNVFLKVLKGLNYFNTFKTLKGPKTNIFLFNFE